MNPSPRTHAPNCWAVLSLKCSEAQANSVAETIYLWAICSGKTYSIKITNGRGFPGGAVVKNPPANAGDMGSSHGPGRFHMPRSN